MSDATTAELLTQVLERLDRMEKRLDAIQGTTDDLAPLTAKAPVLIEAAASTAQFAYDTAEAQGIDPINSGVAALEIAAIAGQPEAIANVKRLVEKQALLSKTLDMVEQLEAQGALDKLVDGGAKFAVEVGPTAVGDDALATVKRLLDKQAVLHKTLDVADKLEADGSLDKLLAAGETLGPKMAAMTENAAFMALLDQAMEAPAAIETASIAATALVETKKAGWQPAGLFAPLSALMDGDLQKALGFVLAIGKRFGQKL